MNLIQFRIHFYDTLIDNILESMSENYLKKNNLKN